MKLLISFMCLFAVATVKAQNWGGGIDDSNLHFGFTFQYVSAEYKILKVKDWRNVLVEGDDKGRLPLPSDVPGKLSSISSKPSKGFGVGFVVNQKIHDNVDLRLTPILVFSDRLLTYHFKDDAHDEPMITEKKLPTTVVDFPLSLKIKSNRRNNFRAYMMGGIKYTMDISSRKRTKNEDQAEMDKFLNNRRNFLSYEAGLGMDLYFEYFKMSPEIKLSYSFNSVKQSEAPHIFSDPIDKLMLRHVTFSLFFE